ncbi:MAG: alpha/beta hydrolase [Rubrivivax sp.]
MARGENWFVETDAAGQALHVRHKPGRAPGRGPERRERAPIVFVHGATYSGAAAYDADLPGGSWMDFAASRGYDTFAPDMRGYGRSWRPPELDAKAFHNRPQVHTEDAVEDLHHVVQAVLRRTGAPRVNLVGWSWGTAICGGYATAHPELVRSASLFAPLWVMRDPVGIAVSRSPMLPFAWCYPMIADSRWLVGAYRNVDAKHAWARWFREVSPELAEELMPREQFDRWWADAVACDPVGAAQVPPVVRAPNGVLADLLSRWSSGRPTWDAARMTTPTLLIVGEWDIDTPPSMAQELFEALTHAPIKRLEVLARGTHSMSLEVNRFELYRRVQDFIETPSFESAGTVARPYRRRR